MTWTYYWAPGPEPAYNQFQHDGCAVGCGPVAWTMLFCWADRQAASGNAYWAPRNGLYRENGGHGADEVAPVNQTPGVDNVIREIHDDVGTFCLGGSGATLPWSMPDAWQYFIGRTGTRMSSHWNSLGIHTDSVRDYAIASIMNRRTPAVIGTGWLSHYPLAYGYAWETQTVRTCFIFCWTHTVTARYFYVNNGWGGVGNEWVEAGTWFAGEIYP